MKLKNLNVILIVVFVIIGIVWGILWGGVGDRRKATRSHFALNTYITLTAYGKNANAALGAAVLRIDEIEQALSAYIPSSEVARLNAVSKADVPTVISSELMGIIKTSMEFSKDTGGEFDITIKPVVDLWDISASPRLPAPQEIQDTLLQVGYGGIVLDESNSSITFQKDDMGIDLGGIAKGYAADEVRKVFLSYGVRRGIINLGGNVIVMGDNATWLEQLSGKNTYSKWTVGIQTPFAPTGEYCMILKTQEASVVSSGAYERNFIQDGVMYHHILSAHTGYPVDGDIDSVSIIGESSMIADALSTSVYILGMDKGMALAQKWGYEVIVIGKDKRIYATVNRSDLEIVDSEYVFN